ncbi:A.superbus venom factor 1-like isoform X2 [Tubulanus polymorphus]|uniref:A.superbus venom factor 1-like isoform X2 n=1 Tax=Tubulanus polymorphus TaxID=672921 RepID=UPI003DA21CD9
MTKVLPDICFVSLRTVAKIWIILTFLNSLVSARRPLFFITAPSVMRYDVEETVVVSWYHENHQPIRLQIFMQDYPQRKNSFNHVLLDVPSNQPNILTMKISPHELPRQPERRKYVYLVAVSKDYRESFREEAVILINPNNGYLFLQSDKPIYTPGQNVLVRAVSLVQRQSASRKQVTVEIKNPDDVTMERRSNLNSRTGFIDFSFHIPEFTTFGKWTIEATRHGADQIQNATAYFEVKKYVLPTFSVKIHSPKFILPQDVQVNGHVTARYVFGQPVVGKIIVTYYVLKAGAVKIRITDHKQDLNSNGRFSFNIPQSEFGTTWNSLGSRLLIEAAVTETSSGKIVKVADKTAMFVASPYKLSLVHSKKNFHAGSTYQAKVYVEWAHGKPAGGVPVLFNATAVQADGRPSKLQLATNTARTNSNGYAQILIPVPKFSRQFSFIARTNNERYAPSQQCTDEKIANPYESRSGSYISLTINKLDAKVGENITINLRTNELLTKEVSVMGVSLGKVVLLKAVNISTTDPYAVQITINDLMSPSVRLMAYYVRWSELHRPEVVADSISFDVDDDCRYKSEIESDKDQYEPGELSHISVYSTPFAHVGILGVDSAIYVLKDNTIITPEKVFKAMGEYDIGCGAGGGMNSNQVFKDVGLAVISNTNLNIRRRTQSKCNRQHVRTKRDVGYFTTSSTSSRNSRYRSRSRSRSFQSGGIGGTSDLESLFTGHSRYCCRKGKQLRVDISETCHQHRHRTPSKSASCLQAFLTCCEGERVRLGKIISPGDMLQPETNKGPSSIDAVPPGGRKSGRNGYTLQYTNIEGREVDERTFFPETWISQIAYTGSRDQAQFSEHVPDSITTWSLSAISISPSKGLCVTKTKRVKVFKPFFVSVEMPYSVVRNEQIELKATIFNYEDHVIPVNISLHWLSGVCTHARVNGWTPEKKLKIEPHRSASVTFPMIPLTVGKFNVTMHADSPFYSDAINKTLTVIAEGTEKVAVVSKVLDPSGKMKAPVVSTVARRHGSRRSRTRGDINRRVQADDEDVFDFTNQRQMSWVDLSVPKEAVSGSVNAKLTITGTIMGPTVGTIIGGMDKMIKLPTGCGEQTMIALAPTVYATKYLKIANKLTLDRENEAIRYMQEGFKKQMVFKKRDGSFSVWPNFRASTWLTAFVVKVFCQAREFVEIDETIICSAVEWLSRSRRNNGAFYEKYKVLHRHMLGGAKGKTALTAFVLIAMKECKCQITQADRAIQGATMYLERRYVHLKDAYTLALVTYALTLVESPRRYAANTKLKTLSKFNTGSQSRYWPVDEPSSNHQARIKKSTWYRKKPSGLAIETASYALLAQLKLGEFEYSKSIAIWLIEQRNSHGAFISTQDSVIGLQALAQYDTQKQSERLQLHARIYFDAAISNMTKDIYLDDGNDVAVQVVDDLPLGGTMYIETDGTGIGQLQVEMRYNVDKINKSKCNFQLHAEASEEIDDGLSELFGNARARFPTRSRHSGRRHYQRGRINKFRFEPSNPYVHRGHDAMITKRVFRVKACIKALTDDMSEMTILDVGLFTGYEPRTRDLDKLKNNRNTTFVQHYHQTERSVIFYMDRIPKSSKVHCIEFGVSQEQHAGQIHSVAVNVYDYYEPATNCIAFYHINSGASRLETTCQGDLCQCAEGKCPECYGLSPSEKSPLSFLEMKTKACNELDYAFKGVVLDIERVESGLNYIVKIQDVLHKGKEDVKSMESGVIFTKRKSCPANCPRLMRDRSYLFIGKDGPKHKDEFGNEWYKYFLEDDTYVVEWVDNTEYTLDAKRRQLAVDLDRLKTELQLVKC